MHRSCRPLHGQSRQPFEWNYFPLLTGRSRGIIGPFFFEIEQEEAVTGNGDRYRAMLNKFLFVCSYVPHSLSYTRCFACCFWRSHYQPQNSCRLITSELRFDTVGLSLWGAVRDKCYADKPVTIDALKDNIREAIGEIQLHTIDNVL